MYMYMYVYVYSTKKEKKRNVTSQIINAKVHSIGKEWRWKISLMGF